MNFMRKMYRQNPLLFVTFLYNAALLLVLVPLAFADHRLVTGQPVWIKPIKFAVSIALYSITLQWMLGFLDRPVLVRRVSLVIAVTGLIEMVCIIGQAARGVQSHFNIETALDGAIFSIMGLSITIFWTAHVFAAVALLRSGASLPPAVLSAVRGAFIVTALGMVIAFFMTVPGFNGPPRLSPSGQPYATGHIVGAPQDAPGIPFFGWSDQGGDLRISHFAGLHAMQILPLFAMLLASFGMSQSRARIIMQGLSTAYFLAVVVLLVQALRGIPFFHIDSVTAAGYAGCLVILAASFAASRFIRAQEAAV